jgi:hypothetical protein
VLSRVHEIALGFGVLAAASAGAYAGPDATRSPVAGTAISMAWRGTAECDDRAAFEAELLGHVSGLARETPAHVTIEIHHSESTGELELTLTTAVGSRALRDPSCSELIKTAAFVLGMSIDTLVENSRSVKQAIDRERIDGSYVEEERPPPPVRATPPPGLSIAISARAGAAADLAVLPAPSAGAQVAAGVDLGSLRVEAEASSWMSQTAHSAEPDQGVDLSLNALGVRGCQGMVRRPALAVAACVGGEVGRFSIHPFGVLSKLNTQAVWIAVSGALSASTPLWRTVSFRADIGFVAALVQPRFYFEPLHEETLHRPGLVSGRAGAGLEVRFR